NASWLMNDSTVKVVRKLKDSQGHPLWQPSLQAGVPDQLLNSPVYSDPDVPVMAANAKSIVYGDFKRAYRIRDTASMSIERLNELLQLNNQVGFILFWEPEGKLVDNLALSAFKNSAT